MSAMTNQLSGDTKQQIKSLLSGGCTQRQAALAVGVDESYVSQLMTGDEEFATEVISARIIALKDQSARDGQYDLLEDKILKKLHDQLHMVVNSDKLVRMLAVVNGAKRRGAQQQENGQAGPITNVINLTLPTAIINRYRTNTSNEVIEVNEQGMVGMPATVLMEKIKPNNVPAAQIPTNNIPTPKAQEPYQSSSVTQLPATVSTTTMKDDEKDNMHELLERKRKEALAARVDKATIVNGQEY